MYSVAISRDGILIVFDNEYGIVRRWDASTGEVMGTPMDGRSNILSAVEISGDGRHIVTGS